MGQQRDAENTDASLEQWIASLCRATLFNVGEMAQVVENIYFDLVAQVHHSSH